MEEQDEEALHLLGHHGAIGEGELLASIVVDWHEVNQSRQHVNCCHPVSQSNSSFFTHVQTSTPFQWTGLVIISNIRIRACQSVI